MQITITPQEMRALLMTEEGVPHAMEQVEDKKVDACLQGACATLGAPREQGQSR